MVKTEFENEMATADKSMAKMKFMDAIRFLTQLKDKYKDSKEQTADILSKMSQAYYGLEGVKTDNAMKYLIDSLTIRKELNQIDILSLDMINLAYMQDEAGDPKLASVTLSDALEVSKILEDQNLILSIQCARADMLSEVKSTVQEAIKIYQEVLAESEKSGDWENYFEASVAMIKIIRDQGDLDKAMELADEKIQFSDKLMSGFKTKKEAEEFKEMVSYLYDVAIDLAMESKDLDKAMNLAKKLNNEK
ncbi:MAG: hypothetical protein M1414_05060 [Candidatus Thermoplasmatota archaeon]|jgi:tetratricopeptide (TPR) repeat protein|nr:hypothetical protein [Candidatus Thermoplasmatota archaeon]MCL5988257.1 hypothetical protein [Candidatus Thermoplasmatota archaeon]